MHAVTGVHLHETKNNMILTSVGPLILECFANTCIVLSKLIESKDELLLPFCKANVLQSIVWIKVIFFIVLDVEME